MCWWQAFICNGLSKLQLLNQGTRSLPLRSPLYSLLLPPGTSCFIFVPWNCAWVTFPLKCQWLCPQLHKLHTYMFRAEGLSSDCHWEFTFNVQLQIPMTVAEPWGVELFLVHEKICEIVLESKCTPTWTEETCSRCQMMNWIILEIVVNLNLKLTSLVVLAAF